MFIVQIIGHLTKDAVTRTSKSGSEFISFSLAVRVGKNKDGSNKTVFINCAGRASGVSPYLLKGKMVAVNGEMNDPTTYTSTNSGELTVGLSMWFTDIKLCGSRGDAPKEESEKVRDVNYSYSE